MVCHLLVPVTVPPVHSPVPTVVYLCPTLVISTIVRHLDLCKTSVLTVLND